MTTQEWREAKEAGERRSARVAQILAVELTAYLYRDPRYRSALEVSENIPAHLQYPLSN